MSTVSRTCNKCGIDLTVDNVTDGTRTEAYMIGCAKCRNESADADVHSSTEPHPLDSATTWVRKRVYN
jgi:hypothetical protein